MEEIKVASSESTTVKQTFISERYLVADLRGISWDEGRSAHHWEIRIYGIFSDKEDAIKYIHENYKEAYLIPITKFITNKFVK